MKTVSTAALVGDHVAANVHYPYSIQGEIIAIEQETTYIDPLTGYEGNIRYSQPLYVIAFDLNLVRQWHRGIASNVFRDELVPGVTILEFPPLCKVLKLFADEFVVLKQEVL